MFSGQAQSRPVGGQRGAAPRARSRLSSLAPAGGPSAPAPLPAAKRAIGLLAPPRPGPSSQRRSISPLHAGSSVNEEQQTALTRELRKAEDGGIKALVKDEVHAVTQFGQLPGDVQEMVQDAVNSDQLRAKVDVATGFAMVWSRKTCHVWNCARRTTATSTCYTFPCPDPTPKSDLLVEALASLALGSLVHHGGAREPGLLLVSPGGELRLWDSLSLALSGVEKFQTVKIALNNGEYVRCLSAVGPQPGTFVLATSDSRLFRVVIFAGVGGRPTILASVMAKGWSFGTLFQGAPDPKSGIVAVAATPAPLAQAQQGAYDIWALEEKSLQRWRVGAGGGEHHVSDSDVRQGVMESLVPFAVDRGVAGRMQIQYLDVRVTAEGLLCLLVSYLDPTSPESVDAAHLAARSFAIVLLDSSAPNAPPIITSVVKIAYKAVLDPRPETAPRLELPSGGPAAFITFSDAIVVVSLQPGSQLEEVVALKDSATNRVIGSGSLEATAATSTTLVIPELTIVTTGSGLLKVEVHPQALQGQAAPRTPEALANLQTAKLKTKLDQAVYFGDDASNPVTFDLRSDFRGDLDTAAQLVSDEILASSSVELAADSGVNLRNQLGTRARYHQALIKFIGANGLLGKLSQTSRRHLASNAELLHVAAQLWQYQNKRMESGDSSSLLNAAVIATMDALGQSTHDDVLRLFFKLEVAHIPLLLQHVKAQLQMVASAGGDLTSKSHAVQEGNDILLTVYRALLSYRQAHSHIFGLDGNTAEPWSSTPPLLDVLQFETDSTFDVIRARARHFGQAVDEESRELQAELKSQATDLADFLLRMYDERLSFLVKSEAPVATTRTLQERYVQARPRAIKGLVEIGKASHAFALGEQYRDYRSLVELCHSSHGSPKRTYTYLNEFKDQFAFELYQWYIEQGRYKELLDQTPAFSPFLTAFLDSTDYAGVAWLQDLETKRFEHASSMLLRESVAASELTERKLMLSISKLCDVAHSSLDALEHGDVLDVVNGRLDIVIAQENLATLCAEATTPQIRLQPPEAQSQAIANSLAPPLQSRPALAQVFHRLVSSVLAGQALSSEELVDFYTLKANQGDQRGGFATALDILQRADEIAAGRGQMALQTIWRRALIHEDWSALRSATTLSDEQISACLRETALYFLFSHLDEGSDKPGKSVELTPAQALFTSTEEDVSARFAGLSIGELGALLEDYRSESEALQTAIDRDGLNDYYAEVARLQREDRLAGRGANGDESMMQE